MKRYFTLICGLVIVITIMSCYGNSIVRNQDPNKTMVVNLGKNRYIYSVTKIRQSESTSSTAIPVVSVVPVNMTEVGVITVQVKYSGWGRSGLRKTESEFYSELAKLSSEIGGTHFHVADKSVSYGYISAMTISVLAP